MTYTDRMQEFINKKLVTPIKTIESFPFVLKRLTYTAKLILRKYHHKFKYLSVADFCYAQMAREIRSTPSQVRYAMDQLRKYNIVHCFFRYHQALLTKVTPYYLSEYVYQKLTHSIQLILLVSIWLSNPSIINSVTKPQLLRNNLVNNINNIVIKNKDDDLYAPLQCYTGSSSTQQRQEGGGRNVKSQKRSSIHMTHWQERDEQEEKPTQVDRRKLFPLYQHKEAKPRNYKEDALFFMNWLQGTDAENELGRKFLAYLGEETVVKLVTRHIAPSGKDEDEE